MASSTNGRPPNKAQNLVAHLLRRQSGDNVFGFRRQLFRERLSLATSLYKRDLVAHFGCVNAIEFSGDGELLVSGKFFNKKQLPIVTHLLCFKAATIVEYFFGT